MNERIRELLIEAREVTKEGNWKPPTHVWADKFAELIVQECATICKDTAEKQFSPLYDRESDGAAICYKKIKEHFGYLTL